MISLGTRTVPQRAPSLLLLPQVFPPEAHPTAIMVRELAEHLATRGWRVTVAAGFPHHPHGSILHGYSRRPFLRERLERIDVVRAWHLVSPTRNVLRRTAAYATQALASALAGMLSTRPDVVLVVGPPLVGPALGWCVARAHGAKLVNVIYDIYPDIAVETGAITRPSLIAAARAAERFQYWAADRTIVLSEGFRRTLRDKGVPERKLAVVPVWLDPDEIQPAPRDNAWRRENDIPLDKTVVLYAGTIGVVSGATVVADAARLLQHRQDILFLLVGEGAAKDAVGARACALGLTNLRLLPLQPRARLREVQATGDIGLVTLAAGRGRTSVPSKVLGYMAAGRPVLAAVDADSDTALQVASGSLGLTCAPDDPEGLAAHVLRLADDAPGRVTMGAAARVSFLQQFAREAVLDRYAQLLEEVARG